MTGIIAAGIHTTPVAVVVQLHNQTVTKSAFGATATASYTIASDGKVKNQNGNILESWLSGAAASGYDVFASVTTGSVTGTTGSWLSCSSDRTWSVVNDAQDDSTVTAVIAVSIRNASTLAVLASASITISATSNAPGGFGGP